MTTPSTARKAGPFTGNGSTSSWPFTFKVFADGDIKVTKADAAGVETVLVLGTNYTVSLNANQETSPGGTVSYLLPSGHKLTITGDLDYDQSYDIPAGGNFNPVALENQLDRMVMQTQQLAEEMARAVKVPVTDDATGQLSQDLADGILALSPIVDDIEIVAGDINAVENVSVHIAAVSAVGGSIASVNTVAGIAANVTAVAGNAANINTVAGVSANVTTVAGIAANVTSVAGNASNINTVAGVSASVSTVAGISGNVSTVAGISGNVTAVAGNSANINTVAGAAADIGIVADNLVDVSTFADLYQGAKSSNPSVRNDSTALQYGDLYYNTVNDKLRVYSAGGWSDAATPSPVTITPQLFSGNGSTTTFTLSATPATEASCDVYVGGVHQVVDVDYNISGTSLVFTSAPPSGTNNIEVKILSAYASGVPENGSVTTPKLADGAVTRAKMAAGAAGLEFTEIATGSFPAAASITFSGLSTAYDGFKLIYEGVNTSWGSGNQLLWNVGGGTYFSVGLTTTYDTNKSNPYAGQISFYNRKQNAPFATPAVLMAHFGTNGNTAILDVPSSITSGTERHFFRASGGAGSASGGAISEITSFTVSAVGGTFTAGTYKLIGIKFG
jgi:hypothetical protein